jgi:tRNA nucleotidyltransferase/poly(A) polymerase
MIITKYEKFLESEQHKDMWDIIPESVKELHKLFQANGKKLFVVGGAVRDFLNGEKPKDFDLATDALPEEVQKILKGYKTQLQGEAFGVVVVYTDDQPGGMEIATFREDVYGAKLGQTRNPDVKFSTIEKDVQRRDIPYNALFFDLDKREIVDLVGGLKDLESKVTRFVGQPELRIQEDPLRILRLFRFNCRYQFQIDAETAQAIQDNKELLKIITKERIWDEIKKAFKQAKDFTQYFELMNRFDIWPVIFPGVKINPQIQKSNYLEIYFANLFKLEDISSPKPGEWRIKLMDIMVQNFKMDIDFSRKVIFLIDLLDLKPENVMELYKKKVVSRVTDEMINEWLDLNEIDDPMFDKFLDYAPSVSSEELMAKGFKGKALGDEIERLEIEKFKQMI